MVLAAEVPPWLSKSPMSLSAWKLSDLPCLTLAAVSTEFRCRRRPSRNVQAVEQTAHPTAVRAGDRVITSNYCTQIAEQTKEANPGRWPSIISVIVP